MVEVRMQRATKVLLSFLGLSLVALVACSGDDGGGKPCPKAGIGANEIANWQDYDCSQPQICPGIGWVAVEGYPVNPANPAREMVVVLTNCSKGSTKLEIQKVVLLGDSRCTMTEPEIEERKIDPGPDNGRFVRVKWKPEALGRDDAALMIYTNAQNKPILEVPICGTAVPSQTLDGSVAPALDGSVAPEPDASLDDAGEKPNFLCKPVTKLNAKCHADPG